jgi:hypothetical protein
MEKVQKNSVNYVQHTSSSESFQVYLLAACLSHISTLKMEAVPPPKCQCTSAGLHGIITEDDTSYLVSYSPLDWNNRVIVNAVHGMLKDKISHHLPGRIPRNPTFGISDIPNGNRI